MSIKTKTEMIFTCKKVKNSMCLYIHVHITRGRLLNHFNFLECLHQDLSTREKEKVV